MFVLFVLVIGTEFAAVPAQQARLASRRAVGLHPSYITGHEGD
jgi:hypothetical protein